MGATAKMIAVVDTNVLFSGILSSQGCPRLIYRRWLDGTFTLITSEEQIAELRTAARASRVASLIKPHQLGYAINRMRASTVLFNVPRRHNALDPTDSFLLTSPPPQTLTTSSPATRSRACCSSARWAPRASSPQPASARRSSKCNSSPHTSPPPTRPSHLTRTFCAR
jgi:hypothetical protein